MENNELQKTRPVGGEWPQFYDSHWREGELVEKTKGYALSGKILLSAIVVLFFVIVLMAGLHLYARWYLLRSGRRHRHIRRRRRRTTNLVFYVDPDDNPAAASARGLDPAVLKSLPVFSFASSEEPAALECAVCLSEFEENEEGRRLPKCNHCFHTECIDMWFHSHATCPLCRAPVAGPDVQVRVFENPPVVPQQVAIAVAEPSPDRDEPGSSSGGPDRGEAKTEPSLVARRKAAELGGVSIEVPRRNASFGRSEEGFGSPSPSPAFKSPGGRMRSLRRILSREIRAALSPSSSAPGCSGSAGPEFDPELAQTPSQRASE